MTRNEAPTFTAAIYIAGDLNAARATCRDFCMTSLCVTIEPVEFIYTGGSETGVRVGLINYPRFPAEPDAIWPKAEALADPAPSLNHDSPPHHQHHLLRSG
jgi:hypothetical protein